MLSFTNYLLLEEPLLPDELLLELLLGEADRLDDLVLVPIDLDDLLGDTLLDLEDDLLGVETLDLDEDLLGVDILVLDGAVVRVLGIVLLLLVVALVERVLVGSC